MLIGRLFLALGSMACAGTLAAQSSNLQRAVGEWAFTMEGDAQPQRVFLRVDGDTLRGAVYGQKLAGTLTGNRLVFAVGDYRWYATLTADTLRGWLRIGTDSSRWSARRFRPRDVARGFTFAPTTFVRELGITTPPALRLYAGDTVRTSTIDAGGWGTGAFGEKGNKRSRGGNPLTGPFYVEGALPGDVLVVKLLRVRLNRGWAFSGTGIIDNAIQPGYAAERKPEPLDNKWTLDTTAGVARLTSPPPALRNFTVPLRPFLGVLATAPGDGVVPSSRESGSFGGNMEYAQLREGTTVYLPVSTTGAYLYIGDGHAAQGDGELTGDAMETSMDVSFTVSVKRWGFASGTRAETADHIMSIGVAGSLDEATRQATSDLARWLQADYTLSASEAAIVMGFGVIYDIPDLVPPQVGVSARLPKTLLRGLSAK